MLSAAERQRLNKAASRIIGERVGVMLISRDALLLSHHARVLEDMLRQDSDLQVAIADESEDAQLLERFNRLLAHLSVDQARNGAPPGSPGHVWILAVKSEARLTTARTLTRMVHDFPGGNLSLILLIEPEWAQALARTRPGREMMRCTFRSGELESEAPVSGPSAAHESPAGSGPAVTAAARPGKGLGAIPDTWPRRRNLNTRLLALALGLLLLSTLLVVLLFDVQNAILRPSPPAADGAAAPAGASPASPAGSTPAASGLATVQPATPDTANPPSAPAKVTAQPETTRTPPARPEPAQPAASRPESAKPLPSRPEPAQPAAPKPEPAQPAAPKPEPAKAVSPKPEPAKPEPAQPAQAKPEPAKPAQAKPEPAQPAQAKPESAKPESARPAGAQPESDLPSPPTKAAARPPAAVAPQAQPPREREPSVPAGLRRPDPPPAYLLERLKLTQDWLASAPATTHTIQLVGSNDERQMEGYLLRLRQMVDPEGIRVFWTRAGGKPSLTAVWGSFPDAKAAAVARDKLPPELLGTRPIVRTVQGINAEIKR
jgi:hypothetical protein